MSLFNSSLVSGKQKKLENTEDDVVDCIKCGEEDPLEREFPGNLIDGT